MKASKVVLVAALASSSAALWATRVPIDKMLPLAEEPVVESCDKGGLSLPPGFCATVFADNLGHARHLAVATDGTVYVNTWSGRYYRNAPPPAGGYIVALNDADGDGSAEIVQRFGPTFADGNTGGTGIALYNDGLYVEAGDSIVRYTLSPGKRVPDGVPKIVLSGLPLTGDHHMHPFIINAKGAIYVNSGSATNVCEKENRTPGSVGNIPCEEAKTRGGIWIYDANKINQHFSPAERYASGLRNTGGLSLDAHGRLFGVQHGRDQLFQNWPALYTAAQGSELPAEELVELSKNADFGWPLCYYDPFQKKLVLGPEYGGDGGKKVGICAAKKSPVAAFPAHWAPNDMVIYKGSNLPTAYRGGAFVAFHGSWNRAPAPQDGYNVVFQPLINGRASAPYILFADGFAGMYKEPGRADYRPAGLAVGPDGALYIADDAKGRVWRVTYRGPVNANIVAAAHLATKPIPSNAGADITDDPSMPKGVTAAQITLGGRIYRGEVKDGTCTGCHGSDLRGTTVGPDLTGASGWIWTDGSVKSLADIIAAGVANPKKYSGAMPPMGGSPLSLQDNQAVAAYIWTISHSKKLTSPK